MFAMIEVLGRAERYTAFALYLYARPSITVIAESRSLVFTMLLRVSWCAGFCLRLLASLTPHARVQHWLTRVTGWLSWYPGFEDQREPESSNG